MLVLVGGQTHNQVWGGLVCSLIDRLDLRSLSGVSASTSPMDTGFQWNRGFSPNYSWRVLVLKRVPNHPWEAQLLPSSLPPCPTEKQEPSLCFPWAQWIRLICPKENSAFWRSLSDCGVRPSKTIAGGDWIHSSKPCMTWGNDLGTRTIQ